MKWLYDEWIVGFKVVVIDMFCVFMVLGVFLLEVCDDGVLLDNVLVWLVEWY